MRRSTLLPLSGDPIVAAFWIQFFPIWKDEIDTLYVCLNAPFIGKNDPLADFYRKLFDVPKIKFTHRVPGGDHGPGLTQMVKDAKEEEIMFIEEDAYVYDQGIIAKQFDKLKQFDFLGSSRGSCDMGIYQAEEIKWGVVSSGWDSGPNFWPNYFFVKRSLLMKTDLNFGSKNWKSGEHIKELDYTTDHDCSADTFGWLIIQLRTLSNKVGYIPQNKAYAFSTDAFDKSYPWIHAGSLSSGTTHYLRDENGIPIQNRQPNPTVVHPAKITTEGEISEYSMRVAWWELAYDYTEEETKSIPEFRKKYREALDRYVEEFALPRYKIDLYKIAYKQIMGI